MSLRDDKLVTPKEAAALMRICQSMVYQLTNEGRLPYLRVGGKGKRGKKLIKESDIEAFMEACRADLEDD